MPGKRKKKSTPKGKNANTSGNSSGASSESECSKTLEILNKISSRFMGPCHKKNGRRKQLTSEIGYEADEEASTTGTSDMSMQSPAPAETSLYDFDESDSEMQISPLQVKSKKSKAKTSTTRSKNISTDKKQKPVDPAVKKGKKSNASIKNSDVKIVKTKSSVVKKNNKQNQENTPINVKSKIKSPKVSPGSISSDSPMFSKTPVVTLQRLDLSNVEGYHSFQRQLRKRKCETPMDQATPQFKPKLPKPAPVLKNVTSSGKRQQRKRDSGVLMSPPSIHKIPAPASTDTSTPSYVVPRGRPKQPDHSLLNESCFGFDSVSYAADTPLQMSPVKTKALPPLTPLSDYVSMDSMQISCDEIFRRQSVENDADVPELFSMEQDDFSLNRSTTKSYKSSSKRRPKKVVSATSSKLKDLKKTKTDVIADKFNTEFDEIEKFQLSIEEM
ncbi:uncharacterized protein LOC117323194 [Pecten maximus]|uniref:uncharacterized protein LOC117323194 n=1 Tax=Pecten maximus TaxID=6579 RepID=UPI001458BC82|nr:uncharacterized protein LOC117323194 [Pecten maximus]